MGELGAGAVLPFVALAALMRNEWAITKKSLQIMAKKALNRLLSLVFRESGNLQTYHLVMGGQVTSSPCRVCETLPSISADEALALRQVASRPDLLRRGTQSYDFAFRFQRQGDPDGDMQNAATHASNVKIDEVTSDTYRISTRAHHL